MGSTRIEPERTPSFVRSPSFLRPDECAHCSETDVYYHLIGENQKLVEKDDGKRYKAITKMVIGQFVGLGCYPYLLNGLVLGLDKPFCIALLLCVAMALLWGHN